MLQFSHDIAGGQGNLIISALQSPNYSQEAGTGWAISQDGSADFHDIQLPAGIGGTTVTFSATAPANPSTGDIWIQV